MIETLADAVRQRIRAALAERDIRRRPSGHGAEHGHRQHGPTDNGAGGNGAGPTAAMRTIRAPRRIPAGDDPGLK